jgi:oleandomycin transport system ATP-binding protein
VRKLIGLTGQYASVDETLTGTENLILIARLLGQSRRDARARAKELLGRFRLDDAADRAAGKYSGGMRRRLDLAASLVGRPRLLYLDEPTTGLDPRSRNDMWDIIRDLVADGVTVLLTTQYLDEADQLADEIVVIDHGRVIATGTSEELKSRTGAQTLTVRPASDADRDAIAAAVGGVASGAVDIRGSLITAPVADPGALAHLVRRLDDSGLAVAELSLRSPSLDEVFLSLTGHPAEDPDPSDAADSLEGSLA